MGIVSGSMKKRYLNIDVDMYHWRTHYCFVTYTFLSFFLIFCSLLVVLHFHFTNFLIRFRVLFNFFIWCSIFKIRKCFFSTFALRCWRNKIQIMFITIYFRNTSITIYKAFIKTLILVFLELFCSLLWSFWTSFWE